MLPRRTDFALPPCWPTPMLIIILKNRGGPGATTKPRPGHGFPPAEPVLFTLGRCFFTRRVSLSSFSCAFVVHFFSNLFFWLICHISISNAVAPSSLSRIAAGRHLAPRLRERTSVVAVPTITPNFQCSKFLLLQLFPQVDGGRGGGWRLFRPPELSQKGTNTLSISNDTCHWH